VPGAGVLQFTASATRAASIANVLGAARTV